MDVHGGEKKEADVDGGGGGGGGGNKRDVGGQTRQEQSESLKARYLVAAVVVLSGRRVTSERA